jgi:hypothetical protein
MSDLVNPMQALIDQAALVKPKAKTVKQYAERLDPKNGSGKTLLLLDISGSMGEQVGMTRKIDLLRRALDRSLQLNEVAIAFHSVAQVLPTLQLIPEPQGGTALHLAIAHGIGLNPGHTLVVSDGQPDDAKQALAEAKKLTGIINTLYIGRDDDYEAIEFMRKLARLGCGRSQTCDVRNPENHARLEPSIKLLLGGS